MGESKPVVVKIPKYFLNLTNPGKQELQNRLELERIWREEICAIHSLVSKAASPHVIQLLGTTMLSISSRSEDAVAAVVMERATCTLHDILHGKPPKNGILKNNILKCGNYTVNFIYVFNFFVCFYQ